MDKTINGTHLLEEITKRDIEVVGMDSGRQHGFTQVPKSVLTNREFSFGAKVVYAMLLKYAWSNEASFPGHQKLADDMGSDELNIRTYLKELEDAKFLEVSERGPGKTKLYRLKLLMQS